MCDVRSLRRALSELPVPARFAVVGALVLGAVGAVAGLIVGLIVYPATSWFAMIELGLPAALVGALLGLAVGLGANARRGSSDASGETPG
jgi:hypothetical protein